MRTNLYLPYPSAQCRLPCLPRLAAAVLLAALLGCGDKAAPPIPAAGGMPPMEVSVITIAPSKLTVSNELPGRLEASRIAQVRARVAGIVLQRVFHEGSEVKAGEVLFRIDGAPFQAIFDSSQANVAKSEANLAQANLKVKRYQPLVEQNAVSRQEYDDALTAQKQAQADLAGTKAARQTASLNLNYATVSAPISGRIGRAMVTEGALVGQGEATPMATIQQLDPIYVNLTQSAGDILRLQRALAGGKLKSAGQNQATVTLITEDGQRYAHPGKLLFADISVDESSGTISLRAEFPNPARMLLPGMYVRAQLKQAVNEQAITVPQQALIRSSEGAAVLIVDAQGKVVMRPVTSEGAQDNAWIIGKGLQAGDRVIVEGLQKVKPGATVKPVPWVVPLGKDAKPQPPDPGQPAKRNGEAATSAATGPASASVAQKPQQNQK